MPRRRSELSKLTEPQGRHLRWFHLHGGTGSIDPHGCVLAGGERSRMGSQGIFLVLVARGYLAIGEGRINMTAKGNEVIAEYQRRRDIRGLEPNTDREVGGDGNSHSHN
jgi:hypothetical protein